MYRPHFLRRRRRSTRKSRKFRLPHCRLTPRLQRTVANIRINLILSETKVIGLHLRRWQYGSIFIQSFAVGSETRSCFETECIMAVQGHPRSLILALIERAYATSYWSSTVTLVLSCPVSETLQVFCWQERPHPYSIRILGVFSLD